MPDLNPTLSRRSILKVAASTAAALTTKPALPAVANPLPTIQPSGPYEVDLADPANDAIWRSRDNIDSYVLLEELYPGDPGDLSGCRLQLMEWGEYTILDASFGLHSLGSSQHHGWMTEFLEWVYAGREVKLILDEPQCRSWLPSAIELKYRPAEEMVPNARFPEDFSEPELRVASIGHCYGVVRGRVMRAFLDCLAVRLASR